MTNREKVLYLLRQAGDHGVTTAEFLRFGCGSRYGGRIHELRGQGHEIDAERVRDGSWRYVLVSDADTRKLHVPLELSDRLTRSSDPATGGDSASGTTVQTPSPAPAAPATDSPVDGGGQLFSLDDVKPSTSHYEVDEAA